MSSGKENRIHFLDTEDSLNRKASKLAEEVWIDMKLMRASRKENSNFSDHVNEAGRYPVKGDNTTFPSEKLVGDVTVSEYVRHAGPISDSEVTVWAGESQDGVAALPDGLNHDGHGEGSDDAVSGGNESNLSDDDNLSGDVATSVGGGLDGNGDGIDGMGMGEGKLALSAGHSDHDGNEHGEHGGPALAPPGIGSNQAEIDDYVEALGNLPEVHVHDHGSSKAMEHIAAMNLVGRDEATHVAIGDGDWFDPNIWSNGEVPGDDAKVLIPECVTVDYSGVGDARLFTVRIDGTLDFATDENSQMIFDTLVASPTGHLIIGTANDPVQPNIVVDLVVADNGSIDVDWDPMLLSRGIVSHGATTIYGAEKDSHNKVSDDPMEGDSSIKFSEVPTGWQVGDTIVIAGTHYDGWSGNGQVFHEPEDEVRVITQIDGDGRIHFDEALVHDHDAPREDLKTSVANYTRNVTVESENAEELEVFERGHVMFMHSDNVDVRYAEFHELGRTDKSVEARDISNIDNVGYDSNVQGRYSLHLHRTGTSDLENPAVLEGNAIYGSPGWGVVHHDSNAVISNTATYDTFGAGFVAETGNETGVWDDNIAIWAQGVSWETPKNTSEFGDNIFDTARGGEGFWFQGRMVASTNNVAASVNNGFAFFHRDGDNRMIEFDSSLFEYDAALYFADAVRADDVPILGFQGNESFASNQGLHVVKANPNQGHDIWSHLDDFTAWSVVTGAHIEYTSHYLLTNFDVVGKYGGFWAADRGIEIGNNVTEIVVRDAKIDGFETGIDLNKVLLHSTTSDLHNYAVVDADFSNVIHEYANLDSRDLIANSDSLAERTPELDLGSALIYTHSNTYSESVVSIEGVKVDSLGAVGFPGGSDSFDIGRSEVINILETQGYYSTTEGQNYFLIDIYLTDRLTGEIFFETHPVYLASDTLSRGPYSDAQFNGTQNITTSDGQHFAGEQILEFPMAAIPTSGIPYTIEEILNGGDPLDGPDFMWIDGYDHGDQLSLTIDGEILVNTGSMTNTDLTVLSGEAILAVDGGQFVVGAGDSLLVSGSQAQIGFDGSGEQTAILDFDEGSSIAFNADHDGFSIIQEFDSSAFEPEVENNSGIDIGDTSVSIELTGLSATAGSQFMLMDADEITGIFDEVIVGGLGARNALIIVDYQNDNVSVELSTGDGSVSIETIGSEEDVSEFAVYFDLMRADLDHHRGKHQIQGHETDEIEEEDVSLL